MATIKGTNGADVYELKTPDLYEALEGDDQVTVTAMWGNVDPGPGNDTIIVSSSLRNWEVAIFYYTPPGPITVDLEEGYALDGWGTRDKLVNVHNIHGLVRKGDKAYGSRDNDYFWVNPRTNQGTGTIFIDGRGGVDEVTLYQNSNDARGAMVIKGSADGRLIRAWFEKDPGFVFEFRNVEVLKHRVDTTSTTLTATDLASFETAGQDILLRGAAGWQTAAPGSAVSISYSFLTERPAEGAEGGTGFTAFSAAQQQIVRDLFGRLQLQTGITFREAAAGAGDIRFGINQQADTRGYAFVPDFHRGQAQAGDVWIDVETAAVLSPGQEGYYALLHEIGHALGLQHPLTESDSSGAVVLLNRFAQLTQTVMIERSAADTGGAWPTWFGAMDVQALRFLYGSRGVSTGADRYALGDIQRHGMLTVVDDGGEDTLDATGAPLGAQLDLRPGYSSSVGVGADGRVMSGNLTLSMGSVIENAIGSAHDDFIIGNDAANRLSGNGGSDILDGGSGLDWALFKGARAAWQVDPSLGGGGYFVSAKDGVGGLSELRRVERARFDDAVVAFDLTKADNAGKALLLIGAVIGRAAMLSKAALLGQVIGLFDQGFTMEQLAGAVMRLPIWAGVLTPTDSAEDIARHLLRTTSGIEPTAADISVAAKALAAQPQGAYLAGLAVGDTHVARIDLVGVATTGFEYPIGP